MVQKGDKHYHCFGCGAHGDAIQFLMTYLKLSFGDSVEALAEKFAVPLQSADRKEEKGVDKALLRDALEVASLFYHAYLLHTQQGREALQYLFNRGISLEFIRRFEVGLAPQEAGVFRKVMASRKIEGDVLATAGLLGRDGRKEFFMDRITFPIRNVVGGVVGFSARKYKEETFGGKYINSPETPLFKKSRILFGLNYCRERITKERKVIIVEGQIDCLKMIEAGFNLTVASLGTAFGEEHVKELKVLGINKALLLFDGDEAGINASSKVGDLFQKEGIEVGVVTLPAKSDPDSFLKEAKQGPQKLRELLLKAQDYLTFQFHFLAKECDVHTPAGKAELVRKFAGAIRLWQDPVMVHESLRKVAELTLVPEEVVGVGAMPAHYRNSSKEKLGAFDPNRILELDLLRWLILTGEEKKEVVDLSRKYLEPSHFWVPHCRKLFEIYMKTYESEEPCDLLSLMIDFQDEEGESLLKEILEKKINRDRAEKLCLETIQKLLDRKWMQQRNEIQNKILSKETTAEEKNELIKEFDRLKAVRVMA